MTLSAEQYQRFVHDLTEAFGDKVDAIEVRPDMLVNAQGIRVRRGKAWAMMAVSDRMIEDVRVLSWLIDRVVKTLIDHLDRVLAEQPA